MFYRNRRSIKIKIGDMVDLCFWGLGLILKSKEVGFVDFYTVKFFHFNTSLTLRKEEVLDNMMCINGKEVWR